MSDTTVPRPHTLHDLFHLAKELPLIHTQAVDFFGWLIGLTENQAQLTRFTPGERLAIVDRLADPAVRPRLIEKWIAARHAAFTAALPVEEEAAAWLR